MFLLGTSIVFFIFSIFSNVCEEIIEVCQVVTPMSSHHGLEDIKQTAYCNEPLNCSTLQRNMVKLNKIIVVFYDESKQTNLKYLIDELSECKFQSMVVSKSHPDIPNLCFHPKTTLVIDLEEDNQLLSSMFDLRNDSCTKTHISSRFQFATSLLQSCGKTVWLTNNKKSQSYIFEICYDIHCDEKKWLKNELHGKTFRVTTAKYRPFVNISIENNRTIFGGIVFEILNAVAEEYQFNYTVNVREDDIYGLLENNSWTGMLGMLVNKEVDIVAAGMTVTHSRSKAVHFSVSFYSNPISIIIHEQDQDEMVWKLLSLFSLSTWMSIFAASALSVVVMYVLHKYSAFDNETGLESVEKCIWYVTCCLTNQGVDNQPKAWSGQTFLAIWTLASFAIISMYSGGLIATLTAGKVTVPYKNLQELVQALEDGKATICIQDGTALYESIRYAKADYYIRLNRWLQNNPSYLKAIDEECLEMFINTKTMAYLDELTFLQQYQKNHCAEHKLIILEDQFLRGEIAFAFQKDSLLRIYGAKENGLVSGWEANYSMKSTFCEIKKPDQKVTATSRILRLKSFGGAFLILGIGLVISVLSFVVEIYSTRHRLLLRRIFRALNMFFKFIVSK